MPSVSTASELRSGRRASEANALEILTDRNHVLVGLIAQAGTDASMAPDELDPLVALGQTIV